MIIIQLNHFKSKQKGVFMENICIEDRKKVTIKGATKVISSTTNQAVVEVGKNNIILSGTNIEVTKLDLDNKEVMFSGEFNAIRYTNKAEKVGLFKRIFK